MAQNQNQNFRPQHISLDLVTLEISSAFETWLRHSVYAGEYRRLLTSKLFRAARVLISCLM